MTFNIQNWSRKSVSMNEPVATVTDINGNITQTPGCFREYMYYGVTYTGGVITGDSFATMLGAGYFNAVAYDLQPLDIIEAFSGTAQGWLRFEVSSVINGVVSIFPIGRSYGIDFSIFAATIAGAGVNNIYSTPLQLLPAIPGFVYNVLNWSIFRNQGAVAFAGGGNLQIQYGNTNHAGGTAAAGVIGAAALTQAAGAQGVGSNTGSTIAAGAAAPYLNTGIFLTNAGAAFTGGDDPSPVIAAVNLIVTFELI